MRRRRKKSLNPGPVLWLLFVANILAGLLLSPITAAAKVNVRGVYDSDRARVRTVLGSLKGKPLLRVDHNELKGRLFNRADVRKAEWKQNLFGRAELTLWYSQPVARISAEDGVVLGGDGTVFRSEVPSDHLVELKMDNELKAPGLALTSGVEYVNLAEVCRRVAGNSDLKKVVVRVYSDGNVCLNSGTSGRVVLGLPEQLDEKFEALEDVLKRRPNLLSQKKQLVLIAPGKPAISDWSGET